jgi:hypothetical protein
MVSAVELPGLRDPHPHSRIAALEAELASVAQRLETDERA